MASSRVRRTGPGRFSPARRRPATRSGARRTPPSRSRGRRASRRGSSCPSCRGRPPRAPGSRGAQRAGPAGDGERADERAANTRVLEARADARPTSVAAVTRSSEESPEPSTIRTPSVGIRAAAISSTTTCAPACARARRARRASPRCLSSISAVKLSLSRFIVRTITDSVAERSVARRAASPGALPEPGAAGDRRPRARRALRGGPAPRGAGERAPASPARGRRRAPRAAASRPPRSTPSIPAPPRRLSNADSSPRIRPVTLRDPGRAQGGSEAGEVGGRERGVAVAVEVEVAVPASSPPASPTPSTSVVKRNPGPRRVSAAHETGSFSFDAGCTGTLWLCAKSTVPGARVDGDRGGAREREVRRAQASS